MRKKLAAQNFRRARQLIDDKDYHPAVEMLREAIRFVPDNAEYRYTLSQVELKNPNWTDQGLANLKEAARLDSRRVAFSVEATRALLDHKRPQEAEPFARRAGLARPVSRERGAPAAHARRPGGQRPAPSSEAGAVLLESTGRPRRRHLPLRSRPDCSRASSGTAVDRDPDGPRPVRGRGIERVGDPAPLQRPLPAAAAGVPRTHVGGARRATSP